MKDQFGSNLTIDILSCWVKEVGEESVDTLKVDVPADHHKLTLAWCLTRFYQNYLILPDFSLILGKARLV